MVHATEFLGLLDTGGTLPFRICDGDGAQWVVKACGNPNGNKVIFNEYVAGRLANIIGLPWPTTDLVSLGDCVGMARDSGVSASCDTAVGLRFIPSVRPVAPPCKIDRPDFGSQNAQHIATIFGPDARPAFHGIVVFENWLLFTDCKYDLLHRDASGAPFFLDGGGAFRGGVEWKIADLWWTEAGMRPHLDFLAGLEWDQQLFCDWLSRIGQITGDVYEGIAADVPAEWNMPAAGIQSVLHLLRQTSQVFTGMFEECFRDR
jgi:hypothetical protein